MRDLKRFILTRVETSAAGTFGQLRGPMLGATSGPEIGSESGPEFGPERVRDLPGAPPETIRGAGPSIRENNLLLQTAELPWRDNAPSFSCIPAGRYLCRPYSSLRFPDVYEVTNVPGRAAILIHTGNHAGDREKGLRSDVEGCILVGMRRGILDGQEAVLNSRAAMQTLRAAVGGDAFELVINDSTGKAG